MVGPDPVELAHRRRVMKIALAAKGIPPTYWDDREVRELEAYFTDLTEMLKPNEEG